MAFEVVTNPTLLKLALALRGVVSPEHSAAGAVEIVLEGDIWARARVDSASPLRLLQNNGAYRLTDGQAEQRVRVVPEASFSAVKNSRGVPLGQIVAVRGGFAMVALGGGCGLCFPGRVCSICRGRELTQKEGELWPVTEVVEALRAAFDEGVAEFVQFHLGYFAGDDAGLEVVLPYIRAVRARFDTMVAVTMHPPATARTIDLTYASGVDALSYNLEAADGDAMGTHFPGRARFFGRERYIQALRHAARVFPRGAVLSELLLGLSPIGAIDSAIHELTGIGVLPVLGVAQGEAASAIAPADCTELLASLFNCTFKAGINLSWARDLSIVTTPLEARFVVRDAPQLPTLLQNLARNRLGAMATRSLSRLRRRLRVKQVRASLDSSHL